ncbi:unnamed protein product, partial [Adineta steineri]
TKLKVRKDNLVKTSSQRLPTVETPVRSISTSLEKKGAQILYSKSFNQPTSKYVSTSTYLRDSDQKPANVPKRHKSAYHSSSPAPVYQRKSTPPFKDFSDIPPRLRIGKHDYIVQRRNLTPDHAYENYNL